MSVITTLDHQGVTYAEQLVETELLIDSLLVDLNITDCDSELHPADKLRRIAKELNERGVI